MTKMLQDVTFVATYEDGSTEEFSIDAFSLRTGDHVAKIIAREQQRKGELQPGNIVSVERAGG